MITTVAERGRRPGPSGDAVAGEAAHEAVLLVVDRAAVIERIAEAERRAAGRVFRNREGGQ